MSYQIRPGGGHTMGRVGSRPGFILSGRAPGSTGYPIKIWFTTREAAETYRDKLKRADAAKLRGGRGLPLKAFTSPTERRVAIATKRGVQRVDKAGHQLAFWTFREAKAAVKRGHSHR